MMTILTRASNSQLVSLVKQIASSGEGEVWETKESGVLAKIYHNPTLERIEKLKVMLANPPADPMLSFKHTSIAWPKDLLKDGSGKYIGFLMPAIQGSRELTSIYNPRLRKQKASGFNWYYLHIVALNIAWIIQAIHDKGYVLGDIKPQNILVNDRALVAVIDTDSFQVRDSRSGKVYFCTVGSEGFTPVELLGKDFSVTEQTEVHDRFRLAVLIHYLLFGYHPSSGKWVGSGDSPDQTELIRKGFWPYGQNSLIRASQNTISLDIVHPEIKRCFLRCFNDGYTTPNLRPTAEDWHNALQVAVNELIVCNQVGSHYYSQNYGKCYWCERKAQLGVDIFPGVSGTATTAVKTTITPSTTIQNVTPSTSSNQTTKASAPAPTQSVTPSTPSNQTTKASASASSGKLKDWQKSAITGTVIGCFVLLGLILTRSQTPPSTQPYLTSTNAQPSPQQRTSEPTLPVVVKPSPESNDEPATPTSNSPTNFVPNISNTSSNTEESRTRERPEVEASDEQPLNHTAEIPLGGYSFYEKNFHKQVSYIRSGNKMVGALYNSQQPATITCFTANIGTNEVNVVWWHNLWQIDSQEEKLYINYSIEDFTVDNIELKQGLDNPISVEKCQSEE